MLDLVVVGAGPHALSLLGRLVDDDPDLMTERERQSIMNWAKKSRSHAVVRKHLKKRYNARGVLPGVAVVDLNGGWMEQWERDFSSLGIHHTRSHADLHPCPFDYQSLRVWAAQEGREAELIEMHHIDREGLRAQGHYLYPFVLPSTKLFNDFCRSIVERYGLQPLVRKGTVEDIVIVAPAKTVEHKKEERIPPCTFEIRLADGSILAARRVVCAMGPGGMCATMPWWWADHLATSLSPLGLQHRMLHSSQLAMWLRKGQTDDNQEAKANGNGKLNSEFPSPAAGAAQVRGRRVLVIGGGQTAGHLALLALKSQASTVTLSARRRLTQKHYDLDYEYVGNRRAEALETFWRLKAPKRVEQIQRARGGGSMSPEVYQALMRYAASDSAGKENTQQEKEKVRLTLLEETEVEEASWIQDDPVQSSRSGDRCQRNGEIVTIFDDGVTRSYDFIWLATGGALDMSLVPILESLQVQRPIMNTAGLPHLQPDLSWDKNCPLHIMGAFAQLQLGPDALNLAGARSGGAIVAKTILQSQSAPIRGTASK